VIHDQVATEPDVNEDNSKPEMIEPQEAEQETHVELVEEVKVIE
jgi:hypothetical protein